MSGKVIKQQKTNKGINLDKSDFLCILMNYKQFNNTNSLTIISYVTYFFYSTLSGLFSYFLFFYHPAKAGWLLALNPFRIFIMYSLKIYLSTFTKFAFNIFSFCYLLYVTKVILLGTISLNLYLPAYT